MFRNLQTQCDACFSVIKIDPSFIKQSREISQSVNSDINNYKILSLSQVNYALFIYNYI